MEYYYQKSQKGTVYRYRIEQDEEPWNPREDDNICEMYIWWNGYNLGDYKGKDMPGDKLNDLIEKYLPDEAEEMYDTSVRDKMLKLQSKVYDKLRVLPIFVYEHGGITISLGNDYPYNDRWDAGMGGFIIVEREVLEENGIDWEKAYEVAEGEVEMYDMYLLGECYGYIMDIYEGNGEWEEHEDSCWGYFSRKYGKELATEIIGEVITEEEAMEAMVLYDCRKEKNAEYGLWLMAK